MASVNSTDDNAPAQPVAMQLVRAAIDTYGRCVVDLYSEDPRLQQADPPVRAPESGAPAYTRCPQVPSASDQCK